jgi:hypothetical protein
MLASRPGRFTFADRVPYTLGLGLEEVADRNFVWIYGHRDNIWGTEQSCGFLQNKGLLERNILKFVINI